MASPDDKCDKFSLPWFSARIMPPKRRGAPAAKAGGKKVKQEETPKPKDAFTSAKEALLAAGPQVTRKRKVDEHCSLSGCEVRKRPSDLKNPGSVYSLTAMQMTEDNVIMCRRKKKTK